MTGGMGRVLLAVGLVAGGWYFLNNYQVEGLDAVRVHPRRLAPPEAEGADAGAESADGPAASVSLASNRRGGAASSSSGSLSSSDSSSEGRRSPRVAPPADLRPIRVATFNLAPWGSLKADKPAIVDRVASLLGQYDLIAVQGVAAAPTDLFPRLVEAINRSGAHYDTATGPAVGRGATKVRMGFLFDSQRLEIDRRQLYSVADPADQLAREPLVGWFRTRGARAGSAWTFSLVCLDFVSEEEIELLPAIYRAVAGDGRHEDDVLLAGGFRGDAATVLPALRGQGVRAAITATPTDLYRTAQRDNLLVGPHAVAEMTGRSGATDFLRLFNLALAEAEEMAEHLPVWAEFSPLETTPES